MKGTRKEFQELNGMQWGGHDKCKCISAILILCIFHLLSFALPPLPPSCSISNGPEPCKLSYTYTHLLYENRAKQSKRGERSDFETAWSRRDLVHSSLPFPFMMRWNQRSLSLPLFLNRKVSYIEFGSIWLSVSVTSVCLLFHDSFFLPLSALTVSKGSLIFCLETPDEGNERWW